MDRQSWEWERMRPSQHNAHLEHEATRMSFSAYILAYWDRDWDISIIVMIMTLLAHFIGIGRAVSRLHDLI